MRTIGVAVFSGFICLLAAGCGQNRSVAAIERVLQADKGTSQATSVAEVVSRMRAIDMTDCPNDFKAAYLAHIHAWESMAIVERKAIALKNESESTGAMVEAFIRGVLLDPFGKANEIKAVAAYLKSLK